MQARPSVNYAKDWLDQLIFLFPGLVWKRFLPWMWSLGVSQQPFSCVLGNFPYGDDNQKMNNRVILVQGGSWPAVRRQSFAISDSIDTGKYYTTRNIARFDLLHHKA